MLAIRRCLLCSSKRAKHGKHKYNAIPSFRKEDFRLIATDPLHALPKQAKPHPKSEQEGEEELGIEPQHDETAVEEPQPNETVVEKAQFDKNLVEKVQLKDIVGVEPRLEESLLEEAQPDKTIVEEAQPDDNLEELAPLYKLLLEEPDESKLNQMFRELIGPHKCTEELGELSINFGSHKSDRASLHLCSEILGSESCDYMVKDMGEAVTEWSWRRKRQRNKVVNSAMLASMGLPPPIPQYAGRSCHFMKVKRRNGRLTMNEVVMDWQPQMMQIERDDGQIKMQLMTYVGDVKNDDDEALASASYYREAFNDDAEASTSTSYVKLDVEARNDDAEASTSAMHARDAMNNDAEVSTSALHDEHAMNADAEASTIALLDGDVRNDSVETFSTLYAGHAKNNDPEASTSTSTSLEETASEEGEEGATDNLNRLRKGKKVAAKAA